jgi:hypothetical protein
MCWAVKDSVSYTVSFSFIEAGDLGTRDRASRSA